MAEEVLPREYFDQLVAVVVTRLDHTSEQIRQLTQAVEGEVTMAKRIEQIPFFFNLALAGLPGSGVVLTEVAPFSGYIKEITIHWPDGCNALVDVRVGHETKQLCPIEGFLALNDATPTYPFSEWVNLNEDIWVEMRNRDGGNTHAITVTVTIEGIIE